MTILKYVANILIFDDIEKKKSDISQMFFFVFQGKYARLFVPLQSSCIKSGTMPTNRPLALRLSKNQFKEQNRWQRW